MKILLQRVKDASVKVDNQIVGKIEEGLLLYVGFKEGDDESLISPHVEKVLGLRVFPDQNGKMNLSIRELKKDLLIVSQFTLYGDVKNGRRPSFIQALNPAQAEIFYETFIEKCRVAYPEGKIETGKFGAMMQVSSINQGPINFIVEL